MFVYVFECSLFDYNLFDYNVQMAGRKKKDDERKGKQVDKGKPPKTKKLRTKKVATFRDSWVVIDRDDHTPTPPMRQATIPSMARCDRFWSRAPGSASATPTGSHAVVPSATSPGSEATLPSHASIPPSRPPRPVRNLTISVVLLFIFVRILDLTTKFAL